MVCPVRSLPTYPRLNDTIDLVGLRLLGHPVVPHVDRWHLVGLARPVELAVSAGSQLQDTPLSRPRAADTGREAEYLDEIELRVLSAAS